MKQNSQWLSQVRTASNTADSTSTPERLARRLLDPDGEVQAAPGDLDLEVRVVDQDLVADDVSGCLAVQGSQLVTGAQPGAVGRGPGRDGKTSGADTRQG